VAAEKKKSAKKKSTSKKKNAMRNLKVTDRSAQSVKGGTGAGAGKVKFNEF
jgi:hypothetical protein